MRSLLLVTLGFAIYVSAQTACSIDGDWLVTNPVGVTELASFTKGNFRYLFVYGTNCNVSLTGTFTATTDVNPKLTFTKVDPCATKGSSATCKLSDSNVQTYCSLGPHLLQIGEVSTSFAAGGCTNWTMSSGFSVGTSAGPYLYQGPATFKSAALRISVGVLAVIPGLVLFLFTL